MNRLKIILEQKRTSQSDIAHAFGVTRATVHKWVMNTHQPSELMLNKLSRYLNIPYKELLYTEHVLIKASKYPFTTSFENLACNDICLKHIQTVDGSAKDLAETTTVEITHKSFNTQKKEKVGFSYEEHQSVPIINIFRVIENSRCAELRLNTSLNTDIYITLLLPYRAIIDLNFCECCNGLGFVTRITKVGHFEYDDDVTCKNCLGHGFLYNELNI